MNNDNLKKNTTLSDLFKQRRQLVNELVETTVAIKSKCTDLQSTLDKIKEPLDELTKS